MRGRKLMMGMAVVGMLALTGCASTFMMTNGPQTPAAEGKVLAKAGPNNNTRLAITVKHLAPPEKVVPGGRAYVVWARGDDAADKWRNLGALKVDSDLSGQLETLTPLRTFELSVTVEPSSMVERPSGNPVLTAHVALK